MMMRLLEFSDIHRRLKCNKLMSSLCPLSPLVPAPAACRHAFDETWGYSRGWVIGETGVVCDWSGVRDGSLDMPTCVTGICGGHNADDVLPFEVKVCRPHCVFRDVQAAVLLLLLCYFCCGSTAKWRRPYYCCVVFLK